ncbi:MAG TPA: hypothetical protein VH143_20225 [Kofleriaceae bacterium]|nr:hypothetical protein [Kofleriaceae bacterium]
MTERGVVRWGRVIAHAIAALISGVVLGAVAVASFSSTSPYEAGRTGGTVGFIAAFATGVASYLVQAKARRSAIVGWTLAAIGAGVALDVLPRARSVDELVPASMPSEPSSKFTDADRAPMIEDFAPPRPTRLRHPTFGFSVLEPPSVKPRAALARGVAKSFDDIDAYGFRDDPGYSALIVAITPDTSDALGKTLDAFVGNLSDGPGYTSNLIDHEVGSEDAHALLVTTKGIYMRVVVHPLATSRGLYFVTLMTVATDIGAMTDILASYRVD